MGAMGRLRRRRSWVWLLPGLCLAGVLYATDLDRIRHLRATGEILALEKILARLPRLKGARILEVELKEKHGLIIYEIERLEEHGQIREYKFNAHSGELLEVEKE